MLWLRILIAQVINYRGILMGFRGVYTGFLIILVLMGILFNILITHPHPEPRDPEVQITNGDAITSGNVMHNSDLPQHTRGLSRAWTPDSPLEGIDASSLTMDQLRPDIASDNNRTIYCVWQDIRSGDWDIYFSKSANFGIDWDTNTLVTNLSTSGGHQRYPAIAVAKSEPVLYTVWQDMRHDEGDIYFSYSINDGGSWVNEIKVNTNSKFNTYQWYPAIACDKSGSIFVVWADYDKDETKPNSKYHWNILLSKSTNKGVTWSTPIMVNDPIYITGETNQSKPAITVDNNGIIYVAWEDHRNVDKQIYISKSTDGGKSFLIDIMVSRSQPGTNAKNPDLMVDENNNLFVTWEEDFFSKFNVYFSKSLDFGITFSAPVRVNSELNKCTPDSNPTVEVDSKGNVFVMWSDQRNNNHIYLGYSSNNGDTFLVNEPTDDADDTPATPISITTEEELDRGQQVSTQLKDKIYVFWIDYRNDPNPDNNISENGDIYFSWNMTPANRDPKRINFDKAQTVRGWGYLNLTWPYSDDLDFTKYKIYKSTIENFVPEQGYLNATINTRFQNYVNITGLSPETTYYFRLVVEDFGDSTNTSEELTVTTKSNIPPLLGILEPDGDNDLVDYSYEIEWWDSDPDDNATIELYYDTNQNPLDGRTLINILPQGEDSRADFYLWDTRTIPNGTYYICALISDPINIGQYPVYSPGKVTIFHGNLDPLMILFKKPVNITNVVLTESVTVRFNKDIDNTTVHQESFYILDSEGNKVDGTYSYNSSSHRLEFSPITRWNGSEKYSVYITTSIWDSSGLFRLSQEYSWWFETEEYIIPYGTIFGDVSNTYYKNPIEGASVILTDKNNASNIHQTITDSSGRYSFTVTYGDYQLVVDADSYQEPLIKEITLASETLEFSYELTRPVIIDFKISNYRIAIGDKLKVWSMAMHPNNELIDYLWDFGDGTIEPGQNISHKYKKVGTYEVTLTVRDQNNGYISQTETIIVEEAKDEMDYFTLFVGISALVLIIGLIAIVLTIRNTRKRRLEKAEAWAAEHEDERIDLEGADEEAAEEEEIEVEDEERAGDEDEEREEEIDKEPVLEESPEEITEEELIDEGESVETTEEEEAEKSTVEEEPPMDTEAVEEIPEEIAEGEEPEPELEKELEQETGIIKEKAKPTKVKPKPKTKMIKKKIPKKVKMVKKSSVKSKKVPEQKVKLKRKNK